MWPWLLRNVLLPAHEALLRRPTFELLRQLEEDCTPSNGQITQHQFQGLIALTDHARREIPYWKDRLPAASELAAAPDLRSALDCIPILMRSEIARDRELMKWRGASGKVLLHSSSGTTDDNLTFYFDRKRQAWDRALRMRGLRRFGVLPGARQLQIWPMPAYRDRLNRFKDPLRNLRDTIRQGIVFDPRPITPENLDRALDLLEKFQPELVVAYPSWMEALARRSQATRRTLRLPGLRLVQAEGEILYDYQCALIASVFGARVAEEFGSHDAGIIAAEDATGRWRLNWEHVHVEILRDGRPAKAGEMGEVVITNLHSDVMPFIRYATGDVAVAPAESGVGGRVYMPKIEGRTSDVLLTTNDRLVPNRGLVDSLVRETGSAKFFLHQLQTERILCMTVRDCGWVGQERRVEEILRATLGTALQVEWQVGTALEPLKSGKHRFVCSPAAHEVLAHDKQAGHRLSRVWPQRLLDEA